MTSENNNNYLFFNLEDDLSVLNQVQHEHVDASPDQYEIIQEGEIDPMMFAPKDPIQNHTVNLEAIRFVISYISLSSQYVRNLNLPKENLNNMAAQFVVFIKSNDPTAYRYLFMEDENYKTVNTKTKTNYTEVTKKKVLFHLDYNLKLFLGLEHHWQTVFKTSHPVYDFADPLFIYSQQFIVKQCTNCHCLFDWFYNVNSELESRNLKEIPTFCHPWRYR